MPSARDEEIARLEQAKEGRRHDRRRRPRPRTARGPRPLFVLVRLFRGPSNLDRIVAAEILMVIVIAGVATESAWQRTATNLPLLLVLGLVGFVGGVAVTRFMSRDGDNGGIEQSTDSPHAAHSEASRRRRPRGDNGCAPPDPAADGGPR